MLMAMSTTKHEQTCHPKRSENRDLIGLEHSGPGIPDGSPKGNARVIPEVSSPGLFERKAVSTDRRHHEGKTRI
jgi:hypothetical protein